jgi:HlyD family secretion protein
MASLSAANERESTTIVKADQGDVVREIVADGNLYSPKAQLLAAEQVGWYWEFTVTWVAEEGQFVKKGDLVAKLDAGRLGQDLTARKSAVEEEKLNVTQEKLRGADAVSDANAEVVSAEFARRKAKLSLIESDSISDVEHKKQLVDVSATEAAYNKALSKVQAAKAKTAKDLQLANLRLARAQEEYDRLVTQSSRLDIRAPADGIVFFPLSPGDGGLQKASPGVSVRVGHAVAEIADPSDLVARFFVPEVDIAGLAEGASAQVSLDINHDEFVAGKVMSVGKLASTQSERDGMKSSVAAHNVRQFEVKVSLDRFPPNAIPGLTARARIVAAARKNVTRVPLEAVFSKNSPDANAESKKDGRQLTMQARSRSKDKWETRQVGIGVNSFTFAEVTEGLKPGDEVLVSASNAQSKAISN